MTYVISRLCRDCVDGSCISVCPCDCIVAHRPKDRDSDLPNQLFINPDECIDCGACEPECPWGAIFEEDDLPDIFKKDIALNAISASKPEEFVVAKVESSTKPTLEEVERNRQRWETAADQSG